MHKTLFEIKEFLGHDRTEEDKQTVITSAASSSQQVTPGALFLARRGRHVDARQFIPEAAERGCVCAALLKGADDIPTRRTCRELGLPFIVLDGVRQLGLLAAFLYGNPSEKLRLLGVTGTNGKTTVTFLIAQMLEKLGKKCWILGTLGCGPLGHLTKSANTTLEPLELQRQLALAVEDGARYAVMEVSSIGAAEGRISGCRFFGGAFTNLTRDHLDYHGSMENYAAAKFSFLNSIEPKRIVINADDGCGRDFMVRLPQAVYFACDSRQPFLADKRGIYASDIVFTPQGSQFNVNSGLGRSQVSLPLLGEFNVSNYLAALSLLHIIGLPFPELLRVSADLKPVAGRMERFAAADPHKPAIIVDYAHTPDGVEQALKAARVHLPADCRLFCILGCGGDRDAGKRPLMALKAAVWADEVIITTDNPRSEDPWSIIHEMMLGVPPVKKNIQTILDRRTAIETAFEQASRCGRAVILIAGKGHEDYQILADRTIHFSDREEACRLLGLPAPASLYPQPAAKPEEDRKEHHTQETQA